MQSNTKGFKVGDKVERVSGSHRGMSKGDTGTIQSLRDGSADILLDKNKTVASGNSTAYLKLWEDPWPANSYGIKFGI